MGKNLIEEINRKMDEMLQQNRAELQTINDQISSAQSEIAEYQTTMDNAQNELDAEGYLKAKDAIRILKTKIEMLEKRKTQHNEKELVTEEESDQVINSILEYENQLAEEYEKDIKSPLNQLRQRTEKYRAGVLYAETTMNRWTSNIHANYQSPTATYADGTHRSSVPVPVRSVHYYGSPVSVRVSDFLEKVFEEKEEDTDE